MHDNVTMPMKTREFHNHHFDSTVWNDFVYRDDDIVIATYGKAGTTWTQQIVAQLLFNGDPDVNTAELSPWLDLRVPPKDANANAEWFAALNDTPGRVGPPIGPADPDIRSYFRTWLEEDGAPFWPFWEHIRSWWAIRHLPNVYLLHFEDLKRDLPGQMRSIADFLDISVDPDRWPDIVEYCTFDWMKAHAALAAPLGGIFCDGGAETFINKGTNGRWRDTLSVEETCAYEERAVAELGETCALWLERGGPID